MVFKPENVPTFLLVFNENKQKIRAFPGCLSLTLLQDWQETNVYYTYSLWADESDLENYRQSALFKSVWARTKALFDAPPAAFSLRPIETIEIN